MADILLFGIGWWDELEHQEPAEWTQHRTRQSQAGGLVRKDPDRPGAPAHLPRGFLFAQRYANFDDNIKYNYNRKESYMRIVNKIMMLGMAASDMPKSDQQR